MKRNKVYIDPQFPKIHVPKLERFLSSSSVTKATKKISRADVIITHRWERAEAIRLQRQRCVIVDSVESWPGDQNHLVCRSNNCEIEEVFPVIEKWINKNI